jgi:transposase
LRGIIFVLKTGIGWEDLPRDVFGCSGVTCWRRLRDWAALGVIDQLQQVLLEELGRQGHLDWTRAAVDSFSVPAKKGGPSPVRTRRTAENQARSTT